MRYQLIAPLHDVPFQCLPCAEAGYYTEMTANEWLHHECRETRALYWLSVHLMLSV